MAGVAEEPNGRSQRFTAFNSLNKEIIPYIEHLLLISGLLTAARGSPNFH
jgi:hypothetical protein